MKKGLSLLLAIVMVLTIIPFSVYAANDVIEPGTERIVSVNTTVAEGDSWTVAAGGKIVINEGVKLTINSGGAIYLNGTIENKGELVIKTGGTLSRQGNSKILHQVRIPGGENGKYKVYRYMTEWVPPVGDELYEEGKIYTTDSYYYDEIPNGGAFWVEDSDVFYFRITLMNDAYDVNKFVITANGAPLTYRVGTYVGTPIVKNSVDIAYGASDGSPVYGEHLRKTIRIGLPGSAEEGYQVVAYYKGTNYTEEVEVFYGDSFKFTVMLDPAYSNSKYTLTIGGVKAVKDEQGYFQVLDVTDLKAAGGQYEIFVAGIMSNEMQDTFNGIFAFLKQIFETIMDIFKTFMDMLSGGTDSNLI